MGEHVNHFDAAGTEHPLDEQLSQARLTRPERRRELGFAHNPESACQHRESLGVVD